MEKAKRKKGFIVLKELSKNPTFKNILWKKNEAMRDEFGHSNIKYIFSYEETLYFYKALPYLYQCYYELMAEELAYDFNLPTAHYDLAYSKTYGMGVLTKNFKLPNYTYYKGYDVLEDYLRNCIHQNDETYTHYELKEEMESFNSLEGIWATFEYRYRNHSNKIEIVNNLTNQLVDIFIFDLLIGQTDRHEENWGIMEHEEEVYLQPVFDNDALLETAFELTPHTDTNLDYLIQFNEGLEKITKEFITVSDSVYIEKLKSKIPLINKENIEKIFLKIENRTYSPIPSNVKEIILTNFKTIQESITSTLNEYEEKKKTR